MTHQQLTAFEKIAGNEQFLLFPHCFLLSQIIVSPFSHIFDIISLFAAEVKEPRIGISGKGLNKIMNLECPVTVSLGLHLLETGVRLNYRLILFECNQSGFKVREYNILPPHGLSTMLYNLTDMK